MVQYGPYISLVDPFIFYGFEILQFHFYTFTLVWSHHLSVFHYWIELNSEVCFWWIKTPAAIVNFERDAVHLELSVVQVYRCVLIVLSNESCGRILFHIMQESNELSMFMERSHCLWQRTSSGPLTYAKWLKLDCGWCRLY